MSGEPFDSDEAVMRRALALAGRGRGLVEPNPMVGAVLVDDARRWIAEGWHQRFGGPHAEIEAMRAAGPAVRGATLFVTLEPCCHHGKTGPCTRAVIEAGIRRVVIGARDPFPQVDGAGIAELERAGIRLEVGLLSDKADSLIAPFRMLVTQGRPWVHAKWAMTLDGKIASHTGESRWITNARSREVVHRLRADMDAIIVGAETARRDDPLLTARLDQGAVHRVALRVVVDSAARLSVDSQLVRTAREVPVLVACSARALREAEAEAQVTSLRHAGVEVIALDDESSDGSPRPSVAALLHELGKRRCTHILVEGGGELLGSFRDNGLFDEVHAFIAPRLMGGAAAPSPLGGVGETRPDGMPHLIDPVVDTLDGDVYVHGRVGRS
jgi:diaminohydroxyphosphoribosylaminopyrimidine deaminase / 5-amino-6-(5-phosphoribosylamino)uracil reductase